MLIITIKLGRRTENVGVKEELTEKVAFEK